MPETLTQETPRLQPPGAGLPTVELFLARLMVGWQTRRVTREKSAAIFASERAKILRLARGCGEETARRRVLVPRLMGMEDSSRFWSVWMTLDHLRIVNHGVGEFIPVLARGETPSRATSTADVKPSPDVDATILETFEQGCARFEQNVASVENLRTTLRWPHPWFGPQDAAGWHYIAAFHMNLHRRQIESILATLKAGAP